MHRNSGSYNHGAYLWNTFAAARFHSTNEKHTHMSLKHANGDVPVAFIVTHLFVIDELKMYLKQNIKKLT